MVIGKNDGILVVENSGRTFERKLIGILVEIGAGTVGIGVLLLFIIIYLF
jgi:hypothetical protein